MNRVDLVEMYRIPDSYKPPPVSELQTCTSYPNLNSIEYRELPIQETTLRLNSFYELLEANGDQSTMILAANAYTNRLWNGSLYGYEKFHDIGVKEKESFKLILDASITNLRFIEPTMLILSNARGSLQLWSTQSEIRKQTGYSLFNIAKKTEHIGIIQAMDILRYDNLKVITASTDKCIKLWNVGPCDLVSERTYRYAHSDCINGVASKPNSNSVFCICSSDQSFSIWDYRLSVPVVNEHEKHIVRYTTCNWLINGSGIDSIYLGDECGNVQIFDSRNIENPVKLLNVHDRPIHKIKPYPNGNLLAILGQSNTIKVFDGNYNFKQIYFNSNANDFIRDICWKNGNTSKTFYSIGWNKQVKEHKIIKY